MTGFLEFWNTLAQHDSTFHNSVSLSHIGPRKMLTVRDLRFWQALQNTSNSRRKRHSAKVPQFGSGWLAPVTLRRTKSLPIGAAVARKSAFLSGEAANIRRMADGRRRMGCPGCQRSHSG